MSNYFKTTSVEVNNFDEIITSPLLFLYDSTVPVPVSLDQTIDTSSVVDINNIEFGTGAVTSLTPRIVLATPTLNLSGSLLATPYNSVAFSGAATADTNLVQIDLQGILDGEILALEISGTSNGVGPGTLVSIFIKCYFSSFPGLTATQLKNNNPIHAQSCDILNAGSTQNISVGYFEALPFRYLYLTTGNTLIAASSIITVTAYLRVGKKLNLYP